MRPEERRVELLVTGQWNMRATIAGKHFNARIANLPAVLEVHQSRSTAPPRESW
jgi:ribosomal protein S12 methylthiotransferase accessory factor YcaO